MKKLFLPLLFILACSEQSLTLQTDRSKDQLRDAVISLEEIIYDVDTAASIVQKGSMVKGWGSRVVKKYRADGFYTEKRIYINTDVFLQFAYEYNDQGQLIEETVLNQEGEVTQHWRYIYNEHGQLIQKVSSSADGVRDMTLSQEYDKYGYISEQKMVNANRSILQVWTYKRDERGNDREMFWIDSLMPDNLREEQHEFDEKDRLVEAKYFLNGTFEYRLVIDYNEHNDPIREQELDADNKILRTVRYEYQYDDKDNWINRVKFIDQKPVRIVERQLIYTKGS